MFFHPRRSKELVYPHCGAGAVFPQQMEQLDGHSWLTLKKRAPKRRHLVSVVWIPGRAVSEQLAHTIKIVGNLVPRFQSLAAVRIKTRKTQMPQRGFEHR